MLQQEQKLQVPVLFVTSEFLPVPLFFLFRTTDGFMTSWLISTHHFPHRHRGFAPFKVGTGAGNLKQKVFMPIEMPPFMCRFQEQAWRKGFIAQLEVSRSAHVYPHTQNCRPIFPRHLVKTSWFPHPLRRELASTRLFQGVSGLVLWFREENLFV